MHHATERNSHKTQLNSGNFGAYPLPKKSLFPRIGFTLLHHRHPLSLTLPLPNLPSTLPWHDVPVYEVITLNRLSTRNNFDAKTCIVASQRQASLLSVGTGTPSLLPGASLRQILTLESSLHEASLLPEHEINDDRSGKHHQNHKNNHNNHPNHHHDHKNLQDPRRGPTQC